MTDGPLSLEQLVTVLEALEGEAKAIAHDLADHVSEPVLRIERLRKRIGEMRAQVKHAIDRQRTEGAS